MRARPAGMDDALGNALMVEMKDFLAKDEILEQRRAASACFQAVLVVGDAMAEIVGEMRRVVAMIGIARDHLLRFAAGACDGVCGRLAYAWRMMVQAVGKAGRGVGLSQCCSPYVVTNGTRCPSDSGAGGRTLLKRIQGNEVPRRGGQGLPAAPGV